MTKLLFTLIVILPTATHAACRIGEPYPYEAQIDCPKLIHDYLERTGACTHFAGEEATDPDRAAFLQETMDELRCDRLRETYEAIWAQYEGDVLYFRLIEAYHTRYGIPYP